MPQPNDSAGQGNENANGNAGGAGASAGSGDNGGGSQGGQPNGGGNTEAERLSREAAGWRTKLRAKETEFESLKQELDELKARVSDASPGADTKGDPEVAKLKRDIDSFKKQLETEKGAREKAESASKAEKLDGTIRKVIADLRLLDADDVATIIRHKGKAKIADDGKPVLVITENGEEREVELTAEAIQQHKVVSERFYPPSGVGGSGSRGGAGRSAGSNVDFDLGLRDPAYFKEHEKEMRAEMARRQQGR
jgi:uncharacterized protein YdcH (DUF465 family)